MHLMHTFVELETPTDNFDHACNLHDNAALTGILIGPNIIFMNNCKHWYKRNKVRVILLIKID